MARWPRSGWMSARRSELLRPFGARLSVGGDQQPAGRRVVWRRGRARRGLEALEERSASRIGACRSTTRSTARRWSRSANDASRSRSGASVPALRGFRSTRPSAAAAARAISVDTPSSSAATCDSPYASPRRSTRCSPMGSRLSSRSAPHPVLGSVDRRMRRRAQRGTAAAGVAAPRPARTRKPAARRAPACTPRCGSPDWQGVQRWRRRRLSTCLQYPWQHERYWLRAAPCGVGVTRRAPVSSESLGRRLPIAGSSVFEMRWPLAGARVARRSPRRRSADHAGHGDARVSARGSRRRTGNRGHRSHRLHRSSGIGARRSRRRRPRRGRWWHRSRSTPRSPCRCIVRSTAPTHPGGRRSPERAHVASGPLRGTISRRCRRRSLRTDSMDALYEAFAERGVEFGPTFRTIASMDIAGDRALAWLQTPSDLAAPAAAAVHPTLLDGALQVCVAAAGGGMPAELLLPVAVERFRVFRPAHSRVHVNARCEQVSAGSRRADIVFRDAAGALVAELSGVRFVPAHSASLAALAGDHWLHEIVWESIAAAPAPAPTCAEGAWLLLCDRAGTGEALARALTGLGQVCRGVARARSRRRLTSSRHGSPTFAGARGGPCVACVHLSTLDDAPRSDAASTGF